MYWRLSLPLSLSFSHTLPLSLSPSLWHHRHQFVQLWKNCHLCILELWSYPYLVQIVAGKFCRSLEDCHGQIHHLRDLFIKEILDPWILNIIPSKDFKLDFILIEKFKFPHKFHKIAARSFSKYFASQLVPMLMDISSPWLNFTLSSRTFKWA